MDFSSLAASCLKEIRKHEEDFKELKQADEKIRFVEEKMDKGGCEIASVVRKWRREPQFQTDFTKSQEIREKGDKLYMNKEPEKASKLYRLV